ncbi:ecto-ADP-ribosyltransferase 5-like isoform X1 [Bufo gargarizans]|uniref:ecto-ADP-ribosyltransferase 5-like isoform X1 n=1 Tax=Bufo gargarizans TaxID=30331 RepID=UPI001CF21F44|nr:ecto-ADP-ribosyltransferase 5-like isoform X1 [Bufo gargarizans]
MTAAIRMSHWMRRAIVLFGFVMMVTSQEGKVKTLDLAEQAFDDQYLGCRRDTARKLEENNVLNIEKENNKNLRRAWKEANTLWMRKKDDLKDILPQGFEDDHGIALLTYTSFIRKDFSNAVKSAGKSYSSYMDDFGYKWLHFYVTTALGLLSRSKMRSNYTVYSRINDHIQVPPNGSIYVKFGHFLYTSLDEDEAALMGNNSLLIIDKYPGVSIEHFSQYPSEREVLVPGYEVFNLSLVEEEDTFMLRTTQMFCSNFNCAYIKGEKSKTSVHECMKTAAASAASPGRMLAPGCSGLVLALLVAALL